MTEPELQDWIRHHGACYPGMLKFLEKLPMKASSTTTESDLVLLRPAVLKQWYCTLRDVDLDKAKAASDAMHKGDIEEPRGWDRHPTAIRKHAIQNQDAKSYQPFRVDGERTYRCAACQDEGWIFCWHPATVAKVRKSAEFKQPLYDCVAPCTCERGEFRKRCFADAMVYHPDRLCELKSGTSDEADRENLLEWITAHPPGVPQYDEFTAYAE